MALHVKFVYNKKSQDAFKKLHYSRMRKTTPMLLPSNVSQCPATDLYGNRGLDSYTSMLTESESHLES